jgi:hypothetical protein
MDFFDYAMLSGMPPIGVDLYPGTVWAGLLIAILLASTLAILCSRRAGMPRRAILRWLSRTPVSSSGDWRSDVTSRPRTARRANEPITLGRAVRLTTGSRK